ncbi:MAG: hemerythrin domain-containing protein [Candidatus Marsarchaeota archaeon]|nr:hemerythrin domain-containing protein [Candidatus Marsarchaeota archaeon]
MLKHFESEEIVFDKLEEKGVKGPVDVMREEHDEMKEKEKEFNLMVNKKKLNKEEVKKFIYIIKYIAEMLKSHIQKEEMILYPLVIEKLSNEELKECGEKAEKLK